MIESWLSGTSSPASLMRVCRGEGSSCAPSLSCPVGPDICTSPKRTLGVALLVSERRRVSDWIHEDAELRGASEKVGALYHRWSAAAEDCILKTSAPRDTKSYVGRRTMLSTRTAPKVRATGESRIVACVISKIQTIDGLRHSGMGSEHGETMIRVPITVFAPRLRELAHQVDPARGQQEKNWAWRAQHVETWVDHVDEVLFEAQAEGRISEKRRRAHATNYFSRWLETAMKEGARVVHRWATQTITSAHPMDYRNSTTPQQSMQARTEEWCARWNKNTEARHIQLQQMQTLRQRARSTTPRIWAAGSVSHSLSSMKRSRSRFVDGWTPSESIQPTNGILAGGFLGNKFAPYNTLECVNNTLPVQLSAPS